MEEKSPARYGTSVVGTVCGVVGEGTGVTADATESTAKKSATNMFMQCIVLCCVGWVCFFAV